MTMNSNELKILDNCPVTFYSNSIRINSTNEEIFLDFGVCKNMDKETQIEIDSKIALSYASVKRLALNLSNHLKLYENRFGNIELDELGMKNG